VATSVRPNQTPELDWRDRFLFHVEHLPAERDLGFAILVDLITLPLLRSNLARILETYPITHFVGGATPMQLLRSTGVVYWILDIGYLGMERCVPDQTSDPNRNCPRVHSRRDEGASIDWTSFRSLLVCYFGHRESSVRTD